MGENVVQEELAVDNEEEVINRKNRSVERNKQRKNVMESDKVSNRNKPLWKLKIYSGYQTLMTMMMWRIRITSHHLGCEVERRR